MDYNQDKYDFSNKQRGVALLIHNEHFYSPRYADRPGDYKDYKHMKKVFKSLGFKICSFRDRTVSEIKNIAKAVAERDDHKDSDCFVCVVASHGEEAQIDTGVHSTVHDKEHMIVGVYGKKLRTSTLVEMFDEDHCEGLIGKPKFFFIQACRIPMYRSDDEGLDKGIKLPVIETIPAAEGKKKSKQKQTFDGGKKSSDSEDSSDGEEHDLSNDSGDFTSDTDDDEEFLSIKQKLEDDTLPERKSMQQKLEQRLKAKREKKDQLDSKGFTKDEKKLDEPQGQAPDSIGHPAEGQPEVVADIQEEKPENEVKVDEKHEEVKIRPVVHKEKKEKHSKRKKYAPQIERPVPMVTMVPCPEDTFIMFASLSGNFAVRGTSKGSWLLNKLYDKLKVYAKDPEELECVDFLGILTEVLTLMSKEKFDPSEKSSMYHLKDQFSPGGFTHCLTKSVHFTKKESKRRKKWLCL